MGNAFSRGKVMTGKSDSRVLDTANNLLFPPWPNYSQDELDAAAQVLKTGRVNYWTGNQGRKFEREFAEYIGVKFAIAVCNGSVALGAALRALDLPADAEVIVTPRTFVATVSEIVLAGARPVFADVDEQSQNLTVETIARAMTKRTAAILVVHLAGWPCDMPGICALAKENGLVVIEDCAQAHGAAINGRKVGAWGDIAAFSFCQDKIMSTAGEGGMIVTRREDLADRCWSFKDHGKDASVMSAPAADAVFRWVHRDIGTNLRLTEIQSAIGRIQLAGLDEAVAQRNRNAAALFDFLDGMKGVTAPRPSEGLLHSFYKCYAFVKHEDLRAGWSRDRILAELTECGIPCGSGICPEVYLEKAFDGLGVAPVGSLPIAQKLGRTSLMFRVDPVLSTRHMARVADTLGAIMERACD